MKLADQENLDVSGRTRSLTEKDMVDGFEPISQQTSGAARSRVEHADLPRLRRRAVSVVAPRPNRTAPTRCRRRYRRPATLQLRTDCNRLTRCRYQRQDDLSKSPASMCGENRAYRSPASPGFQAIVRKASIMAGIQLANCKLASDRGNRHLRQPRQRHANDAG